jgi:hypothetical protein
MQRANKIAEFIKHDHWSLASGENEAGPMVLRFRVPVPGPRDTAGYGRLLTILWAYDEEDSGAMPSPKVSREMGKFEDRLCEALETDALAVLTAVLTFDGARQWVLYTGKVKACGERINNMPQNKSRIQ